VIHDTSSCEYQSQELVFPQVRFRSRPPLAESLKLVSGIRKASNAAGRKPRWPPRGPGLGIQNAPVEGSRRGGIGA